MDKWRHLFQLLHVEWLVEVQAGVLVFSGGLVDEPLQEPLRAIRNTAGRQFSLQR